MSSFLKAFLENEKAPAEAALMQKPRDVISLDAYAMDEDEEEEAGNCGSGCSGCACR